MTLVVFLGFLPSFFLRAQFRETPLPFYLLVHATIMTAWQILFLSQTVLVAVERPDLHRLMGMAGAALAGLVVVAGVYATLIQPALFKARGASPPFPMEILVVGNLFGFLIFAGLIAVAITLRRDTATHRRLIYWACVVTMGPALTPGRTLGATIQPFFPTTFPPELAVVWIAWIARLIHDWSTIRRFHPATIIGGMLILFLSPALVDYILMIDTVSTWTRSLASCSPLPE